MDNKFYNFYKSYKGGIIGAAIGASAAILILLFGFLKTLFIVVFTLLGYWIGKKVSNKEELFEFLDRILSSGKDE